MPKIYLDPDQEYYPFRSFEDLPEGEFQCVAEVSDAELADLQKMVVQFKAYQERLEELIRTSTTWIRYDPETGNLVEELIPESDLQYKNGG